MSGHLWSKAQMKSGIAANGEFTPKSQHSEVCGANKGSFSRNTLDTDSETEDIYKALALRVRLGIKRKQVALGRHQLISLCKRRSVGLVWASETLSHHALGKLKLDCRKYEIPLLLFGSPERMGETTGQPSVKVYILKKSFSGLNQVINEFKNVFIHLK